MGASAAIGGGALLGGAVGGIAGGSGPSSTSTTTVQVPEYLRPLVRKQADVGLDALTRLSDFLPEGGEGRLVAPFDPLQLEGQNRAVAIGRGEDPIFTTGLDALTDFATGEYLYGTPGFDAAVDASIRAAKPHVLSTFGRAGGRPGGLADVAIQQAASDAFARYYNQGLDRQVRAAQALPALAISQPDILQKIGLQRQQQQQREELAPLDAVQLLLAASGGGIDLNNLLGATLQSEESGIGELAGALTGALGGAQGGLGLYSGFKGLA